MPEYVVPGTIPGEDPGMYEDPGSAPAYADEPGIPGAPRAELNDSGIVAPGSIENPGLGPPGSTHEPGVAGGNEDEPGGNIDEPGTANEPLVPGIAGNEALVPGSIYWLSGIEAPPTDGLMYSVGGPGIGGVA